MIMRASLVAATVATVAALAQPAAVDATLVANAGVLLAAGEQKVLIDALFQAYDDYPIAPAATQLALTRARAPFDGVDLVLVTHRHGDHFHPAPVAAHLRANRGATLVTSQQVIDSLRAGANFSPVHGGQVLSRTMTPGSRRRETINGITVELLGIPHGGDRHRHVEHLGFIVHIGGRRVLHVGDTDVTAATYAPLRLDTARIDVALIPAWAITNPASRAVIQRYIRPRQVVGIHLPTNAREARRTSGDISAAIPGAVALATSGETRRW
jgi:L-ascorbate metabolism protein UlaG (beta-lactamase superfamily)